MTRGFVLGKFMPPHSGHLFLCETARRMVDELTILVCWLPDDPVPGEVRLQWMQHLFADCRVVGHGEMVPQAPEEHPDFWPIWRAIMRDAHPEPIDFLFAGEAYGAALAEALGAFFIQVGTREARGDASATAAISGSAIRAEPWRHWRHIPDEVRPFYARSICLQGPESTGKTELARRLARHFDTDWVPEYGRIHCETHGLELTLQDLLTIGRTQSAMIAAALRRCNRRLIVDTDALMTAAWAEMLFGRSPPELSRQPRADLYLLLEPDVPWRDDGTRFFGEPAERTRFMHVIEQVLADAGVKAVRIGGGWEERFRQAVAAVDALRPV